jgi:hypothetical protein
MGETESWPLCMSYLCRMSFICNPPFLCYVSRAHLVCVILAFSISSHVLLLIPLF